jgi:hypothetical protein
MRAILIIFYGEHMIHAKLWIPYGGPVQPNLY